MHTVVVGYGWWIIVGRGGPARWSVQVVDRWGIGGGYRGW